MNLEGIPQYWSSNVAVDEVRKGHHFVVGPCWDSPRSRRKAKIAMHMFIAVLLPAVLALIYLVAPIFSIEDLTIIAILALVWYVGTFLNGEGAVTNVILAPEWVMFIRSNDRTEKVPWPCIRGAKAFRVPQPPVGQLLPVWRVYFCRRNNERLRSVDMRIDFAPPLLTYPAFPHIDLSTTSERILRVTKLIDVRTTRNDTWYKHPDLGNGAR